MLIVENILKGSPKLWLEELEVKYYKVDDEGLVITFSKKTQSNPRDKGLNNQFEVGP
jgi:hypothetical protein